MKKLTIAFLLLSSLSFAYTRKEQIQENLSKIGIKQAIIDETKKIDYEIRDIVAFENDKTVIGEKLNKLLAILKKDERNYIVSEDIITIYESKIGKGYEKYLDLFTKYTPYEYEKLFAKMVYYRGIGKKDKSDSYYKELEKKYNNTPIMEIIKIFNIANENSRQIQIKKVLNLLKSEDVKRQLGMTDEEVHSMNLTYTLTEVRKYYNDGKIEKAVSEYINNVVNANVSNEVHEYNRRKETLLLLNVLMINEEIANKKLREQNKQKLENTYISKEIKKATAKDSDYLDKYLNEMQWRKLNTKKIFLFICLILIFISCGKFDRKKHSNKDLKNLDFSKNYDFKHKESFMGEASSVYYEWNLECIELNCSISYLNEEKNYSKKIALVLKDYKQKNKIMKQIVNGMKKLDKNVIVSDYYPESRIAIYDKNEHYSFETSVKKSRIL